MNIYNNSKWTRIYHQLMERSRSRGLKKQKNSEYERHHILPKSLGGTNESSNLVLLTRREHFVAHRLLVRMCINPQHRSSMYYAIFMFGHKSNSRKYQIEKTRIIKDWIVNDKIGQKNRGKKRTSSQRNNIRNSLVGRSLDDEHKKNIGKGNEGLQRWQAKKETSCPHCGKIGAYMIMKRWHFDKCSYVAATEKQIPSQKPS